MIHPYARCVALFGAIISVSTASSWRQPIAWWCLALLLSVPAQTWREAILFHVSALLPITIGLGLIHSGEIVSSRAAALNALIYEHDSIAVVVGRIAVVGLGLQAFALPLLREDALQGALRCIGVGGSVVAILISVVNAIRDLTRFTRITLDAMRARGLARGIILWRLRELPNLVVSVFSRALAAGISREEMWQHRGIRPELAIGDDAQRWVLARSWLLATTAVALVIAGFEWNPSL